MPSSGPIHFPVALPFTLPEANASALRELTLGLGRGDDAAWAQFHRDYGPGIFRQLLAATRGDHDLATEALQQTYLRVARSVRACDSQPGFVAWLRVVARSVLLDCWRRRQSFWQMLQRRHAEPTLEAEPSSEEENRILVCLDRVFAELDAEDRMLLEAKYFVGDDVRALAEKLSISPKAAESRLTRARAELRTRLIAALSRHE